MRKRTAAALVLLPFFFGSQVASAPLLLPPAGGTTYFLGQNYGTKSPSDPLYLENEFALFYPDGACPISVGCGNMTKAPVFVFLRGGNTNASMTSPNQISPMCETLRQAGFVIAVPSYHIVDMALDEDYLVAAADLARMIQYLRRYRTILNIDPDRIFTFGHSGGGFYSYFLGLNVDFQNPNSRDLIERESSRPNFISAWGTLTDWGCLDMENPATNPALAQMFLSASDPEAELHASPVYWLLNGELFGCPKTPPMCLAYNQNWQTPCGQVTDFHDGFFGNYMMANLQRWCDGLGVGQDACSKSILVDTGAGVDPVTQQIVDWVKLMAN